MGEPYRDDLDRNELRLLSTYAAGPRIWDAASIFALVVRLEEKGLLAPLGDGRYQLTAAGSQVLAARAGTSTRIP